MAANEFAHVEGVLNVADRRRSAKTCITATTAMLMLLPRGLTQAFLAATGL
jgi:hypothetical protein